MLLAIVAVSLSPSVFLSVFCVFFSNPCFPLCPFLCVLFSVSFSPSATHTTMNELEAIVNVDGGPRMTFQIRVSVNATVKDLQAAVLAQSGMDTAKLYPGDNRDPTAFVVMSYNNRPLSACRTLAEAGVVGSLCHGTTPVRWWPANV